MGFRNSPYNAPRENSSFARHPDAFALSAISPDPQLRNRTNSPLKEAVFMRYFVVTLAPWFDPCDPERNFALVVPHRARTCPPLIIAIVSSLTQTHP